MRNRFCWQISSAQRHERQESHSASGFLAVALLIPNARECLICKTYDVSRLRLFRAWIELEKRNAILIMNDLFNPSAMVDKLLVDERHTKSF